MVQVFAFLLLAAPAWAAWGTTTGSATCQDESASLTTLACGASENLEVGQVVVLICAGDNVTTTDGNTNDHGTATDASANSWTKLYEFTNGQGAAAAGATVSIHVAKLTTQINVAADITCNYNTAVTDRAMHITKVFTITSGNVVSLVGTPQGSASDGADAGSLTVGGLTSAEYLWVRGIATESNAAVSMTATAGGLFALPTDPSDGCNNTATGGEASDMGACSEWDVATATTNTSDPTLVDTTNDNVSAFVALKEATPGAGAPIQAIIVD